MNANLTVRQVVQEGGLGASLTYPEWDEFVTLADAVAATITLPLRRLEFVARAAIKLSETSPSQIGKAGCISYLLDSAEAARPTPLGSTELWGAALERVEA